MNQMDQMDESWYQKYSPTKEQVLNHVNNSWFLKHLNDLNDKNLCHNLITKYQANFCLNNKIINIYNKKYNTQINNFKYFNITFEVINLHPQASIILNKIINEEVLKASKKGFGSYQGFHVFIIKPLNETIIIRAIQEIWADYYIKKKLSKIIKHWIHKRYAPNGKGYLEAKKRFEERKKSIY